MANVITVTQQNISPVRAVNYITVTSDGSDIVNYVVFNSAAAAASNRQPDPLSCKILKVRSTGSVDSAARIKLAFEGSPSVHAVDISPHIETKLDFTDIAGLANYAGVGRTGNILLNTTGLVNGDTFIIVLEVRPN
jgi:hypothetical protein